MVADLQLSPTFRRALSMLRNAGQPRIPSLLILAAIVWLLAGCGGASRFMQANYLESNQAQLTIPVSSDTTPVRFVVEPGTPAKTIGANLQAAGLIRDAQLFEAYVSVNNLATGLDAGTFALSPGMTIVEIAEALQNARAMGILVTVREGWRIEQTADFLTRSNIFNDMQEGYSAEAGIYRQIALSGDISTVPGAENFSFVAQRPPGASLEGYLFPDTYELAQDAPRAVDLIARQLEAFRTRVLPLYQEAVATGTTTLSLHEAITMASIVEREAVIPEERPDIAGVYLNRLRTGMLLEADPTVQYAMGYQPNQDVWWKTPVSLAEYGGVISPYNTYLNAGLPPGPIAGSGLSSIRAVLNPAEHGFYYFVAVPDGTGAHIFATTFEEHYVNVQRYWAGNQ